MTHLAVRHVATRGLLLGFLLLVGCASSTAAMERHVFVSNIRKSKRSCVHN
jgi:hypothetical protein